MSSVLQSEQNVINPGLLRLDTTTAYIRGDSNYYKPFPGPEWFTPARMAEINKRICRIRACMIVRVGSADVETAMEIEHYYLHLLAKYQFTSFGGEIGPDPQRVSKRHPARRRPRSLKDWHKLLDFLSDRMFYWAKQHRVNVAHIEAMTRIWLLIRHAHKNQNEFRSLQHANDLRNSRSNSTGRKPGSRCGTRRSIRRAGSHPTVSKGNRPD